MRIRLRALVCLALLPSLAAVDPAVAAWPHDPLANLVICAAAGLQQSAVIVPDDAGGALIAWQDLRSGNGDIYAHHVLADGTLDPAWPAGGLAVCTAGADQQAPVIATDGAGGAIVAWDDLRSGEADVYAQHVLVTGANDPAWPVNGRAVCTASGGQYFKSIVADGAGGAIVAWRDSRNGTGNTDIYAQRVLASGVVDPAWPGNGFGVCGATGNQEYPEVASDGAGGAIVTWRDPRGATSNDIYAQRVLASGSMAPGWPADGRALCTASGSQINPRILADGAGGALIAWTDFRSGYGDIYVHHVLATGVADPAWPTDGRALCAAAYTQANPQLTTDLAGGAIVTWDDERSGVARDVYAARVLSSGTVSAAWPADGRALCTATNHQDNPRIAPDGAGGAVVTWQDLRLGGSTVRDIYAQHVGGDGVVDPAWPADGLGLSTAAGSQYLPVICPDGRGAFIATWGDARSDASDVYAQRVLSNGLLGSPEPEIAGVTDVPDDQGGKVLVLWDASYLDAATGSGIVSYTLWRRVITPAPESRTQPGAAAGPAGEGRRPIRLSPEGEYWEYMASVPARGVPGYGHTVSTTTDSLPGLVPWNVFFVDAVTSAGGTVYVSLPDSGYSVDNLSPAAPVAFSGEYAAGVATLHWRPAPEPDLAGYRLHRGGSADFVPGPGNLIATPSDTGHVDPAGTLAYYKLAVLDVHGNVSSFAVLLPEVQAGVPGGDLPRALVLQAPDPNPTRWPTTLRFGLPQATWVRLSVHDAAGRRVRDLVSGARPAGEHALAWDLRDEHGRVVGPGLYFLRLETGMGVRTRRMVTLR